MKVISEDVEIKKEENLISAVEKNDENKNVKNKRDLAIELIRIVACLIVIATHLSLQVFNVYDQQVDWSRLFQKCFLTDAVPLFFMITGFFIANGRSYKKIWKSTAKKILLPSFVFVLFTQVFRLYIVNQQTFLYCIQNLDFNFAGIIESLIKADVTYLNGLCDHLWYVFAYVRIVIWIPLLWLVCKEEKTSKLARRIMIGLSIFSLIITDFQRFIKLPVGEISTYSIIGKEILFVLLGYELFVQKDKIKNNKKLCIISLILFGIVNVIRYKVEMKYMVLNSFTDIRGRENFLNWNQTIISVISAISLFIFLYSFEIKNEKLSKIILWISDKTFGIYLIHYLILAKVDLYRFEKIGKVVYELIYMLNGIIITFAISIIIVTLIKKILQIAEKLTRKYKKV